MWVPFENKRRAMYPSLSPQSIIAAVQISTFRPSAITLKNSFSPFIFDTTVNLMG
jgi:hypothetical protein